jgi:hypothetical protein
MNQVKAIVVAVAVCGLISGGLMSPAFAGGDGHVKEVIKHAKEGIAHEKEALEHAKESMTHAEESLAHAEQATHKAKGKAK